MDALDIKVFQKKCLSFDSCSISENKGVLIAELKKKILQKAAYTIQKLRQYKRKTEKFLKLKFLRKKKDVKRTRIKIN